MPNETLDATTPPTRVLKNRSPPGRAASKISITTITVLENSPPYAPVKPTRVFTWESSLPSALRRANQVPAPPPMAPSAFSGPRLAPPINDTAETAAIPGTSPGSTCSLFRSANRPGICSGRRVRRRSSPTTTPAAAVTATHHQCPPNQPGSESAYHLPPKSITPTNTRPANAPNIPRATAYPIRAQNSRFCVTGTSGAGSPGALITQTSSQRGSHTQPPPQAPARGCIGSSSHLAPTRNQIHSVPPRRTGFPP